MPAHVARAATWVVDANVIVPFALPEARSAEVRTVFDAASDGTARLIAPSFWRIECGNVVWKYVHRRLLDAGAARAAFDLLYALPIVSVDTEMLMDVALDVAIACDLTMYDSLYIAAALFADAPLVTMDGALVELVRELEVEVLPVSAFTQSRGVAQGAAV